VPRELDFPGAVEARDILEEWGISLDNAANGVYLPITLKNAAKAVRHPPLHTKTYARELLKRLRRSKSAEEVLIALDRIRKQLLAGTFPH
jgi:hypothetical protein